MNLEELTMLKESLELLANGKDPKTGYLLEDTVLTSSFNKKLFEDATFIIDQLLKLDLNPTKIDRRKKYAFYIPMSERKKIQLSPEPIPISVFTYKLNDCINESKMKKIKASEITSWLMKKEYLAEIEAADGKRFKVLTENSSKIGISSIKKESASGRTYEVNLYSKQAQKFIIEHLDEITNNKTILE